MTKTQHHPSGKKPGTKTMPHKSGKRPNQAKSSKDSNQFAPVTPSVNKKGKTTVGSTNI